MHINFFNIPSLCWEFIDFREHKQGGDHSNLESILTSMIRYFLQFLYRQSKPLGSGQEMVLHYRIAFLFCYLMAVLQFLVSKASTLWEKQQLPKSRWKYTCKDFKTCQLGSPHKDEDSFWLECSRHTLNTVKISPPFYFHPHSWGQIENWANWIIYKQIRRIVVPRPATNLTLR